VDPPVRIGIRPFCVLRFRWFLGANFIPREEEERRGSERREEGTEGARREERERRREEEERERALGRKDMLREG